ncbi:hypothetical protein GN244_ATG18435 [Phytophthora infestans]|uniref:Uncharacterized protein n=1 Tax=Phytophthora infestans TaxID=4787 RepID=A0A833SQV6_PHYIN|nr:hypothetical protein GN244_ATG18435 [Phytophthora infestans]
MQRPSEADLRWQCSYRALLSEWRTRRRDSNRDGIDVVTIIQSSSNSGQMLRNQVASRETSATRAENGASPRRLDPTENGQVNAECVNQHRPIKRIKSWNSDYEAQQAVLECYNLFGAHVAHQGEGSNRVEQAVNPLASIWTFCFKTDNDGAVHYGRWTTTNKKNISMTAKTKQEHGRPPTQERKDRGKAMLDFKRQKLEEISKLRREEVELKKLELVEKAQQTDRAHEIRMREI